MNVYKEIFARHRGFCDLTEDEFLLIGEAAYLGYSVTCHEEEGVFKAWETPDDGTDKVLVGTHSNRAQAWRLAIQHLKQQGNDVNFKRSVE